MFYLILRQTCVYYTFHCMSPSSSLPEHERNLHDRVGAQSHAQQHQHPLVGQQGQVHVEILGDRHRVQYQVQGLTGRAHTVRVS